MTASGSFTDPGSDAPWNVYVNYDSVNHPGLGTLVQSGSSKSFSLSNTYNTPGNYTVQVTVQDLNGAGPFTLSGSTTFNVTVNPSTFHVTSFTPQSSGFDVQFNRAADLSVLNLYSGFSGTYGPPDVTVVGNTTGTSSHFSLVWDSVADIAHVIKTGGVLAPDTYTVTLVSGAGAWKDTSGNLLDGSGGGGGGGNYTTTFTVGGFGDLISVPAFARGPGQAVNIPGNASTGLPISISDGTNVTAVDFELLYDPALLTISSVDLSTFVSNAPGGWSVTTNASTPGDLHVSMSGAVALGAAAHTLLNLTASVPSTATYGKGNALRFTNLRVDEGGIAATGVNVGCKVAFLGDASGNRGYSATDASLISNVVVGNITGFDAFPLTDPIIVADVTGDGSLSGQDASDVLQQSVGISVPQIPALPPGNTTTPATPGKDPTVTIPSNIPGTPGGNVTVPVDISAFTGLSGANFTITFNAAQLVFVGADAGDADPGWSVLGNNGSTGTISLGIANPRPPATGGPGAIANLQFTVKPTAPNGSSPVTVAGADGGLNEGGLPLTTVDGSVVIGTPPQVSNVLVDGTAWSSNFLSYLSGLNAANVKGYSIPTGASQSNTLPWINLNQISIGFTEDVVVHQNSLQLVGVNVPNYTFSGFIYNSTTHIATWSLASPIATDKLRLDLSDSVTDTFGNALDGEWTDGSSTFPSGNGQANGAFHFSFNVVPGDANQSGVVNVVDTGFVQNHQASSTATPASYSIFGDVNGDGVINVVDTGAVKARQASQLPSGNPPPPAGGAGRRDRCRKPGHDALLQHRHRRHAVAGTADAQFQQRPVQHLIAGAPCSMSHPPFPRPGITGARAGGSAKLGSMRAEFPPSP